MGDSEKKRTADNVAAILHNPVYVGIGKYPRIVSDEDWLKAATKLAKKEGINKFFRHMLKELRAAFGRSVEINENMRTLLESQYVAFVEKFKREPNPDDPIFFDPDADEPKKMNADKVRDVMVEAGKKSGLRPELIHAIAKTGMVVSMRDHWSAEDLEEWDAAVQEGQQLIAGNVRKV